MVDGAPTDWPALTFPADEAALVDAHYSAASVILEYGSGGSTVMASRLPDKLIFSVESDPRWALDVQAKISGGDLPSPAILFPVDIGPIGTWGRPMDGAHWQNFYRYPVSVWAQTWFRHPDVVLIDGRLRPACFVATCLRVTRPAVILFDDYTNRKSYHVVEELFAPTRLVGRMAEFRIEPRDWPVWVDDLLLELCTKISYSGQDGTYRRIESEVLRLRDLSRATG